MPTEVSLFIDNSQIQEIIEGSSNYYFSKNSTTPNSWTLTVYFTSSLFTSLN